MENGTQKDYLIRLMAEIEKTVAAYEEATALRQKKIEQEIEQIKVYYDIINNQPDAKLNSRSASRLDRLLSKTQKSISNKKNCREKQDKLERRFLKLQESLVGLISKQFKYR
jgi:hypothetical protein